MCLSSLFAFPFSVWQSLDMKLFIWISHITVKLTATNLKEPYPPKKTKKIYLPRYISIKSTHNSATGIQTKMLCPTAHPHPWRTPIMQFDVCYSMWIMYIYIYIITLRYLFPTWNIGKINMSSAGDIEIMLSRYKISDVTRKGLLNKELLIRDYPHEWEILNDFCRFKWSITTGLDCYLTLDAYASCTENKQIMLTQPHCWCRCSCDVH